MTPPDRVEAIPLKEEGANLWRGVAFIVALGAVLGIAQNALMRRGETLTGLKDFQRRSLAWIKVNEVLPQVPSMTADLEPSGGNENAAATASAASSESPQPPPSGGETAKVNLPMIPALPQPMEVQLPLVKAYVDQHAAAIIDARPRDQYDEGHIPGAVNLPFDEAVSDPARLESFDAKGRPIIVYCGGGTCEASRSLAFAMLQAGQKRLVVFTGGYPEWTGAGYPVATAKANPPVTVPVSGSGAAPAATVASAPVKLPVIPSLPQPMEVQLALVKAYVDQNAAAIIDARPRDQFDEGHIPGAVNMPFDEVVTDPARLELFDAKGKPIIVYCGGGTCESSKNLAFAMLQAGQKRLVVFTGGFPEWSAAGYPVATAATAGKSS